MFNQSSISAGTKTVTGFELNKSQLRYQIWKGKCTIQQKHPNLHKQEKNIVGDELVNHLIVKTYMNYSNELFNELFH